jgi:hypothetical protein
MAFLAMTVMARSNSGGKLAGRRTRRHPLGRLHVPRSGGHGRAGTSSASGIAESEPAARGTERLTPVVSNAGTTQDSATYNCQCGYVFEAPVMTTVACPHCKTPQAW